MEHSMEFGKFRIPHDSHGGALKAVGPGIPSQLISQAAAVVWLLLPADRRTPEEIAGALHSMVDRSVLALAEDEHFFEQSNPPPSSRSGEATPKPEEQQRGDPSGDPES